MLAAFYGNATPFTVTSAGLPGTERHFTSFAQAVQQVEDARIYAGFHFRFSTIDGAILGARVARYVTATLMRPEHWPSSFGARGRPVVRHVPGS